MGTESFRTTKNADYSGNDVKNRKLGLAGEKLVLRHERETLEAAGRSDLAECVRHISVEEGDGAGYDIESRTPEGEVKFIEVKTTRSGQNSSFVITRRELAFSGINADRFYLYRVYDYDYATDSGKFYIVQGDVEEAFVLTPMQYRAACR